MLHKILSVSGKMHRFPILSKRVGYFDPHLIRSKIWCNIIENSYGGQNRKYSFVHFHIYLYIRNRLLEAKIIALWSDKKHIIPKTEINLVSWIRFAYVCLIFETTTLCYLFLTLSSVKNIWNIIIEEKKWSNLKSRVILSIRRFKNHEPVHELIRLLSLHVSSWCHCTPTKLKMSEPVTYLFFTSKLHYFKIHDIGSQGLFPWLPYIVCFYVHQGYFQTTVKWSTIFD